MTKTALETRLAGLDPKQRAALAARLAQSRSGKRPLLPRPGPRDTFPVGMDQERLWILDQLFPGTTTYTLGFGLRFLGEFNRSAFTTAVETVVRRHELLRCSIEMAGVEPRLRVHPERGADLGFHDLSGGLEQEKEQRRAAFIEQQVRRPFDLSRDPVLRIGVADLGGGDHQIVQTMPHSFTDQWSYVRLNQELIEGYRAAKEGRAPQLPELPVQFGDYAQWQRDYFATDHGERHRAFWREHLADFPGRALLPYDHPTDTDDRTGAHYHFVLDRQTVDAFVARAKESRSTVANAMTAAYAALLFEESGERDFVIGVPSVTRSEAAVQDLIGFLLTNVPVRVRIPEKPTPRDILAATQTAGGAVAEHHETPFGEIVKAIAPERSVNGYPLLQTMLVHLDLAESVFYSVPNATVYANAVPEGVSSMDITVAWWHLDGIMFGRFEYRTALFDQSTIERLARRLLQLVKVFATAPDTPLAVRPSPRRLVRPAWCEALALDSAESSDVFSESGGTVLLAVRLAKLLRAKGLTVSPQDLVGGISLGEFTELVVRANPVGPDPVLDVPGQAGVSVEFMENLFAQTRGIRQEDR